MLNTIFIIGGLTAILLFSIIKLVRDTGNKKVAKEGKMVLSGLQLEGFSKSQAWSNLGDNYKKAMRECDKFNIKY